LTQKPWQQLADLCVQDREWLADRGVPSPAITEPWPIHSARVEFDDLYGFAFDPEGKPALILKAEDRGKEKDLVAWEPSTGNLASWHGNTFCLGELDQIYNPATYFSGGYLRIHASPLEWLRAGREGIVILRRDFAYAHLRFCRSLLCDDPTHAEEVDRLLKAPKPTVKIFIADGAELESV
jgi:hypothetical protein